MSSVYFTRHQHSKYLHLLNRVSKFVGRTHELNQLQDCYNSPSPRLVVIKGRRRIGKSRLIYFFATRSTHTTGNTFWYFSGLAPDSKMTSQTQRDHFSRQLAAHLNQPACYFTDWFDAFCYLGQHSRPGDIILFDEISWMGDKDPSFIPKLKAWWDQHFHRIMLIFCGSVSTWIEKNILNSTAFFGRVSLTLTLGVLSIAESNDLLRTRGFQASDYDTYKLLCVLGGIPWYLEQIGPGQTADYSITRLCFSKDGLLATEFDRMFHDLFNSKHQQYKALLHRVSNGMTSLATLRDSVPDATRTLSTRMDHLITAGFVQKQVLWSFKTQKPLKQTLYRLSEPYTRFYLKVIEPNRHKLNTDLFKTKQITSLPGYDAHIGLQLEYLLLQNEAQLIQAIGIHPADIIASGPFRQTGTKAGCQIDFLIQTTTRTLFICEFKFKQHELDSLIIAQVQKKINSLKVPRGFAKIPVLFHISDVTAAVATQHYFYRIINIADFLRADCVSV